jgi:hypothetical protein
MNSQIWVEKNLQKVCVRRESNPGPIEAAEFISSWQRWILPLNHKRYSPILLIDEGKEVISLYTGA